MSIKKQFLKSKPLCKVTFELEHSVVEGAEEITLVGDFNSWDQTANPMEKLKKGTFKTLLELETGKEYQFRYLVNKTTWINDPEADKQVASPFGDNNSVIAL